MADAGSDRAIPVVVIGGYLGAGKTTLVNHLLRQGTGRRTLVLVNDFGKVAVDAELIDTAADGVLTLTNGCVCCSMASPLVDTLVAVRERPDAPELVVIETSGVADPVPVSHHAMIPGFRLDGVVVVADAETVRRRAADRLVGRTIERQLRGADVLVLNKVDLVDGARRAALHEWLAARAPSATVVDAVAAAVPVAFVVGASGLRSDPSPPAARPDGDQGVSDELAGHETWSGTADLPVALADVEALLASLPEGIVRAKGILRVQEDPGRRWVVQVVGRRRELVPGRPGGNASGRSHLVVIGLPGSLDDATLARLGALFPHPPAEPTG